MCSHTTSHLYIIHCTCPQMPTDSPWIKYPAYVMAQGIWRQQYEVSFKLDQLWGYFRQNFCKSAHKSSCFQYIGSLNAFMIQHMHWFETIHYLVTMHLTPCFLNTHSSHTELVSSIYIRTVTSTQCVLIIGVKEIWFLLTSQNMKYTMYHYLTTTAKNIN